jgi:aspartate aminotransferase-like enzyme
MTILNMSCGQTDLHPDVLQALGRQFEGPIYYPPYWRLEVETIELLRRLMNTGSEVLLIAGSATYGIEAALISLLEPGEKVIVANSGMYGQVLVDVSRIIGCHAIDIKAPTGRPVTAEMITEQLALHPDAALVAAVHCDTSVGVQTRIDEIGAMLQTSSSEALFLVDGVSAAGAVEIRVDDWHIDVYCTSPQKCLNAPQGLAMVAVGDRAWAKISRRKAPIKTLCTDLTVWRDYHEGVARAHAGGAWSDISTATRKAIHGPSPSYSLVAGLNAGLKALFREGLDHSFARHAIAARAVRAGVRAMGLGVRAEESVAAPISTHLEFDRPVDWTELAGQMLEKHGIALASDFRIGTMGGSADARSVLVTLEALESTLVDLGYPVTHGVDAAREVLAEGESLWRP